MGQWGVPFLLGKAFQLLMMYPVVNIRLLCKRAFPIMAEVHPCCDGKGPLIREKDIRRIRFLPCLLSKVIGCPGLIFQMDAPFDDPDALGLDLIGDRKIPCQGPFMVIGDLQGIFDDFPDLVLLLLCRFFDRKVRGIDPDPLFIFRRGIREHQGCRYGYRVIHDFPVHTGERFLRVFFFQTVCPLAGHGIIGGFFLRRAGQGDHGRLFPVQFWDRDGKPGCGILNVCIFHDVPVLWCPGSCFCLFPFIFTADRNAACIRYHSFWKAGIGDRYVICNGIRVRIPNPYRIIHFVPDLPFKLARFLGNRWICGLCHRLYRSCLTVFYPKFPIVFQTGIDMAFCLV